MTIEEVIKERILILDGAMGTMIQAYHLTEDDFRGADFKLAEGQMKGNNDMLNITRPDVIADIHRKYLEAESRRMALEGARLARKMADEYSTTEKPRFVAGSVGPTNKTCSMSPDVSNPAARDITYDQLFDAYYEQMDALIEGGVDTILIETIFDSLNAKVAIDAATTVMRDRNVHLPVMLSVTVSDLAGRTLSGQTLEAFLASVSTYDIFSVGLNCSFGARQMKPFLEQLASKAPYYISAHPNAGLPNSMGLYDETAESMSPQIGEFIDEGLVNIVGGCCGTTDEFIARYVPLAKGKTPHRPMEKSKTLWLSGLELMDVTPEVHFVNVVERCNVAG